MKKVSTLVRFFLSPLCLIFLFFSCNGNGSANLPKSELKTEKDSLAYAIGLANSEGVAAHLFQSRIDSAFIDAYIKGILDAANLAKVDTQQIAYFIGTQMGQQFTDKSFNQFNNHYFKDDSTKYLNREVFLAGLIDGILKKNVKMSMESAPKFAERKLDSINAIAMEQKFGENKIAGEKFLEENKAVPGIVTLASGIQYKVIKEGNGEIPTLQDRVKVHYKGTLIDGTKFDGSFDESGKAPKEPQTFSLTNVIPGWTEILQLMPVGSKWEIYIPQDLAYGSQDRGAIKPFSTLVFELELVDIVKPEEVKLPPVPQDAHN